MTLFEKLAEANKDYMDAMKLYIEVTEKETKLRLEKDRVRKLYTAAKNDMWFLEQEAKQFKIHTEPLTERELQVV